MKAAVWTAYGPPEVLQLREVEMPVPGEGEIRIRVHASTVSAGDAELRGLKVSPLFRLPLRLFVGFLRPTRIRVLGQEIAGVVESVGAGVTRFKPGDPVFGTPGLRLGGYAEYLCMPAKGALALKPEGLSFEQAATLPVGGIEALHYIGKAELKPGEKMLIIGAGGCIGTFAVQLAKQAGVAVTAVDSTPKLEKLRALGADRVIDFTKEKFYRSGERYDAVFDVIGKGSYSGVVRSLNPGGRFLVGNPRMVHRLGRSWANLTGRYRMFVWSASTSEENLLDLANRVASGSLRPVIDRVYALEQAAEAHAYAESGEKVGHIVIRVGESASQRMGE